MQFLFLGSLRAQLILLLTSLLLFTIGCDDDHGDDHLDVHGFILENSGEEVYRQLEGAVTDNMPPLSVGETLELTIHFLDHDGEEVGHDDDHDDEGSLSITVADESIATVTPEEHEEDGSSEHEMALEIVGIAEGSTSFTLVLMHGEDHADYTASNSVGLTVIAGN